MSKIPAGINKEHILKAIVDFDGGFAHEFHESTEYDLIHEKRRYPPKAIVGLAARYIIGQPLKPKDFAGGLKSKCFRVLEHYEFTILPKPKKIGFWIFQTNPDKYDVDIDLINEPEEVFLEIKTHKHRERIRIGDRAFIWRASGRKTNAHAGIIATCTVVDLPGEVVNGIHKPKPSSHWVENKSKNKHFCKLKIEDLRLSPEEGMLSRSSVASDEILEKHAIVQANQGATFSLDTDEFNRIMFYWKHDLVDQVIEKEPLRGDSVYFEGRARERRSLIRERCPEAREDCLKLFGYDCSVCGMNFEERYGVIGKQFIEVHHIDPVASKIGEYQIVPKKDLIPVCPNCHRMIHRKTPPLSVEELKSLIKNE
jgi:5-methylcytosine-specific restriction protein A